MSRPTRFALPATLALFAFLSACSGGADSDSGGDTLAASSAIAGTPASKVVDTPADTTPLKQGETELTGIAFRLPPGHSLRTTGGGTDFRIFAISPSADTTAALLEFYLGDRPQFDAKATRESRIHGMLARDRVAKLA